MNKSSWCCHLNVLKKNSSLLSKWNKRRFYASQTKKLLKVKTMSDDSAAMNSNESLHAFDSRIRRLKATGRSCICIEDQRQRLRYFQLARLSNWLNTAVNRSYCFQVGRRDLLLVCVQNVKNALHVLSKHASVNSKLRLASLDTIPETFLSRTPLNINDRLETQLNLETAKRVDDEQFVQNLTKNYLMTEGGALLRYYLVSNLEAQICRGSLGKQELLPFGSSTNGFGSNEADLDIGMAPKRLDTVSGRNELFASDVRDDRPNYRDVKSKLREIANQLQYTDSGITNVQRILQARIPIIKCQSSITGLSLDLSMQGCLTSGVLMSHILFTFSQTHPVVRQLAVVVKVWAKRMNLTQENPGEWITNFGLLMLLISFLQVSKPKVLPSITDLGILPGTHQVASALCPSTDRLLCSSMLCSFFEFLTKFDFHRNGFSLLKAQVVPKPFDDPLYIENPLEPELNICRNLSLRQLRYVIESAQISLKLAEGTRRKVQTILLSTSRNSNLVAEHGKTVDVMQFLNDNE